MSTEPMKKYIDVYENMPDDTKRELYVEYKKMALFLEQKYGIPFNEYMLILDKRRDEDMSIP